MPGSRDHNWRATPAPYPAFVPAILQRHPNAPVFGQGLTADEIYCPLHRASGEPRIIYLFENFCPGRIRNFKPGWAASRGPLKGTISITNGHAITRALNIDDPSFTEGFSFIQSDADCIWRWTTGRAFVKIGRTLGIGTSVAPRLSAEEGWSYRSAGSLMPLAQAGREQRFRRTVSTLRCCFFPQLVERLRSTQVMYRVRKSTSPRGRGNSMERSKRELRYLLVRS